ncbi:o-succinylbenzoate--CoA ligase [Sulfoacidibacillus thermotolerans]|uniref:2-succinylbenzoate--CoA ligase n=1 Tax=Sulfoacidibacillus thermotolerans TaxID=1765684 RepID=A0A2U3D9F3_SULT2|nr:o-succinylbenzoate--CoA ligase [Sulfoacidibacillus thermotolerans]PWI57906.1 o-succinylbenzoate--CoA ligase [Sulfoacidibacillus thermotolerans]
MSGAYGANLLSSRVPDWLSRQRHSEQLAIAFENETWSYKKLYERVGRLAGFFAAHGVQKGDRVALLARHGLVFAASVHSFIQLEAVLVPLNTRLAAEELAWQIQDAGIRLLVYDDEHRSLAMRALAICRTNGVALLSPIELDGVHWDEQVEPIYHDAIELSAIQCMIYTSGTTGRPKAARISYGNHLFGALGSALRLGVQANDRWLTPLPLFHVGGQSVLLRSVIYGTAALIQAKFDPLQVNSAIYNKGATLVSVVPAMLFRMLAEQEMPYPSTLRNVLLGGGPAPRTLLETCLAKGVPVSQSYGLTEANSQVATLSLNESLRKLGSSGQALAFTEICIMGKDGPLPPYQEGEIALRGPTIFAGYDHNPVANEQAFRDGWFYTGDIGYVDDEEYLYVLDRRADLILSGGENVYPAEVEAVLLAHQDILEAGVSGMSDEHFGQVPFAAIKVKPGSVVDPAEVQAFCRERLAGYKVPRKIVIVDELPRNASGKLLRRELSKWL